MIEKKSHLTINFNRSKFTLKTAKPLLKRLKSTMMDVSIYTSADGRFAAGIFTINNREQAIEGNNDTYCVQKRTEKFPLQSFFCFNRNLLFAQ